MGRQIVLVLMSLFFSASSVQHNGIIGKWRTIDDETGKPISVVEIFESHGKFYGNVVEIFDPKSRNKTCTECEGTDKNKPIIGLQVIKGLRKDGKEFNGGKILDPKYGKLYKCSIELENTDKLKVRGFVGISLFGRTQYWQRVK
jgi:uncharacterized protein (DUF2147 family)